MVDPKGRYRLVRIDYSSLFASPNSFLQDLFYCFETLPFLLLYVVFSVATFFEAVSRLVTFVPKFGVLLCSPVCRFSPLYNFPSACNYIACALRYWSSSAVVYDVSVLVVKGVDVMYLFSSDQSYFLHDHLFSADLCAVRVVTETLNIMYLWSEPVYWLCTCSSSTMWLPLSDTNVILIWDLEIPPLYTLEKIGLSPEVHIIILRLAIISIKALPFASSLWPPRSGI